MGCSMGFSNSSSKFDSAEYKNYQSTVANCNPDPADYKIIRHDQVGKFLIIEINYPNCTNYEGNKILMFKGITLVQLFNQRLIDPHFSENSKWHSPIARFVPTEEGFSMARGLAEALNGNPDYINLNLVDSN